MLCYMYQAALYCDACGRKLIAELIANGKLPPGAAINVDVDDEDVSFSLDDRAYDSDAFPKFVGDHSDESADSPQHCASDEACENALDLTRYGAIPELHGAETRRIGAWLENPLTREGMRDLADMLDEARPSRTPYQAALHAFWREAYGDYDLDGDGRRPEAD